MCQIGCAGGEQVGERILEHGCRGSQVGVIGAEED
jgi:hypothetical protein